MKKDEKKTQNVEILIIDKTKLAEGSDRAEQVYLLLLRDMFIRSFLCIEHVQKFYDLFEPTNADYLCLINEYGLTLDKIIEVIKLN
jgi:hypothetical protein